MERFEEHIQAEARSVQIGYAVVNFYAKILSGTPVGQDGFEDVVMDLLADIRHFCNDQGLDFTKLLKRGTEHYEIESGIRPEIGFEVSTGEMVRAEDSAANLEKQPIPVAPDTAQALA
jgi:hypothetical protein